MIRHPGLKEELYLGDFEPDPAILERVGLSERPQLLAVARTAAAGAAYHRGDNPLFLDALRALGARDDVGIVVLARLPEQRASISALGLPNLVLPEAAVDSRSLLASADLFIGAGGTMTREAALLGVPTLSMFAGRPAAVDGWLEGRGDARPAQLGRSDRRRRPRAGATAATWSGSARTDGPSRMPSWARSRMLAAVAHE